MSVHVNGCLSHLSLCGPAIDWRPVQAVPCLLPSDSRDRLPCPWVGLGRYRKLISRCLNGFSSSVFNSVLSFTNHQAPLYVDKCKFLNPIYLILSYPIYFFHHIYNTIASYGITLGNFLLTCFLDSVQLFFLLLLFYIILKKRIDIF